MLAAMSYLGLIPIPLVQHVISRIFAYIIPTSLWHQILIPLLVCCVQAAFTPVDDSADFVFGQISKAIHENTSERLITNYQGCESYPWGSS